MRNASSIKASSESTSGWRITNPDRIVYPEVSLTKGDLANYYASIADWVLPHLIDRPLSLVRCPGGRKGACFFQRHFTTGMPESLRGIPIDEKGGRETCLSISGVDGLMALVQFGTLEIHPWGSRISNVDEPDRLIFDLDPGPGVAWNEMVASARLVRDRLSAWDLTSFVRTTGGKGLHVVVPLLTTLSWDMLKRFARAFSRRLQADYPGQYVTKASKALRHRRIYVDYLRNERGATAIASYSSRAREGAPVATPIRWSELSARLDPTSFTIKTIPSRLARVRTDPWEGFFTHPQTLKRSALGDFAD